MLLLSGSLNIGKRDVCENWINKGFDCREIKYWLIDADSMVVCGGWIIQSYLTLATSWTLAHQASLSMGFPRQEYWTGLSFLSPDFPNPASEPQSPALQADSLPTEPPDSTALAEFLQRMKHPYRNASENETFINNIFPCFLSLDFRCYLSSLIYFQNLLHVIIHGKEGERNISDDKDHFQAWCSYLDAAEAVGSFLIF